MARFNSSPQRPKATCVPHDNPFQSSDTNEKNPVIRYLSYLVLGVAVVGVLYTVPQHGVGKEMLKSDNEQLATSLVLNADANEEAVEKTETLVVSKPAPTTSKTADRVALVPLLTVEQKEKPMASKDQLPGFDELEAPVALPQRPSPVLAARVPVEKTPEIIDQAEAEAEISNDRKPASLTKTAKPPEDIPEEAREEYVKALLGNAQSQALIASFYDEGHILNVDPSKALHWYTKAGENGHAGAQNHLGVINFKGIGVKKDHEKAS